MEARLIYSVDGVDFELERMPLEELDLFTYKHFLTEEDIIDSPRYSELLNCLSRDGKVKVVYDGYDIPVDTIDHLLALGGDPYERVQVLSVLTRDRKIQPIISVIKQSIAGTLSSKKVVEEFHDKFKDQFTAKEELLYCDGMVFKYEPNVFNGIKRIINEALGGSSGYVTGRVFLDGLSNFESIENIDNKGRLCAPCLVKKK